MSRGTHNPDSQPESDTGGWYSRWGRWRTAFVLVVVLVLAGMYFMRHHGVEAETDISPPPPRENQERSKQIQPGILKLRGREFEAGNIGESLFKFVESGAPDYARTVLVFKNIDFASDAPDGFSPSREKELDDLAAVLLTFPGIRIEIGAHSDLNRDFLGAYTASRADAETIKSALVAKGIPAGQLETRAFGFEFPLTDNISEEAKAQNRRVELLLLEMDLASPEWDTPAQPK